MPQVTLDEKRDHQGDFKWMMTKQWPWLLAQSWFDNKVTNCLSTIHHPESKLCERGVSGDPGGDDVRAPATGAGGAPIAPAAGGRSNRQSVAKPLAVVDYTHNMGGVDLADQKRSYYEIRIASKKWPTHVFFWLIDAAVTNAHTAMMKEQNHDGKHRLKGGREFRRRLVWELAMNRAAGARAPVTLPDSPAARVAARRRRRPASDPAAVPTGAGAAAPTWEVEYGDHVAVSRNATDGGGNKRCVYCAAKAETAKKEKQRVPTVHKSIMVCSICVKEKRGRGQYDDRSIALCTRRHDGAAHSCFWLWHEAKFGHAADARIAAAATLAALPQAGQAAATDIANA